MNISSIFSIDGGKRVSRAEVIHRDNERGNLLILTKLVLRSFLEQAMKSTNRIVECETQGLSDLLLMLERVLWHGFKNPGQKSVLNVRTKEVELWFAFHTFGRNNEDMNETINCVNQLDGLLGISKIRAFLRLALMQKKLEAFFNHITHSPKLSEFYEPWALVLHEDMAQITGSLAGLSVLDCNLLLNNDHLKELPGSIDISLYIKIPTIGTDPEESTQTPDAKEIKEILDQNNYLEERNRYLQSQLNDCKAQVEELKAKDGPLTIKANTVSFKNSPSSAVKMDEVDKLLDQISELEDSHKITQQQLMDTKKMNADLYDKLNVSDECVRQLEKDFLRLKNNFKQDKEALLKTIETLEKQNANLLEGAANRTNVEVTIRDEYEKKCVQYENTLKSLEEKQRETTTLHEEVKNLREKCYNLKSAAENYPSLQKKFEELTEKHAEAVARADQSELALEELGDQLSVSKLKMVELAEELLPLTDAQWENDSDATNCRLCTEKFSISKRKHHCRICGLIFCATCSEGRAKVPSNPKPVRVCDQCFVILKPRQT